MSEIQNHNFEPHEAPVQFIPTEFVSIVKQRNAAEQALESAHVDKVTNLPDGVKFEEDIQRIVNRLNDPDNPDRRHVVLMMGDVDGLKRANDGEGFGRKVGDNLLRSSAAALVNHSRPGDGWYRLGGGADEFMGILRGVKPNVDGNYEDAIKAIADQKSQEVEEELREAGLPVDSLRLGMQFYGVLLKPGDDIETVKNNLDKNLKEIKRTVRKNLPEHLRKDERLDIIQ